MAKAKTVRKRKQAPKPEQEQPTIQAEDLQRMEAKIFVQRQMIDKLNNEITELQIDLAAAKATIQQLRVDLGNAQKEKPTPTPE